MTDDDVIISELQLYKNAGGQSIVDTAANGMFACRDKLSRISRKSGVHIICGTGFYVDCCAPNYAKTMSEREMVDFMIKEITMGIGATGIKAGIIGEIGCSWPLTDFERHTLRAAAICQKETGKKEGFCFCSQIVLMSCHVIISLIRSSTGYPSWKR